MKLNNKGFMMAEVVVVSAIVLTFLAGLYLSYNKIFSVYKTRLTYYDAISLYRLAFYQDYYRTTFDTLKTNANSIVEVTALDTTNNQYNYNDKVYLIHNSNNNLPTGIIPSSANLTYQEYGEYVSASVDLTNTEYVMLIERCTKADKDDCKYAYLEVE